MSEKPSRYAGLSGGIRPGSGRKPGQYTEATFKKLAADKLKTAINNPDIPLGVAVLACGFYLLITKTN